MLFVKSNIQEQAPTKEIADGNCHFYLWHPQILWQNWHQCRPMPYLKRLAHWWQSLLSQRRKQWNRQETTTTKNFSKNKSTTIAIVMLLILPLRIISNEGVYSTSSIKLQTLSTIISIYYDTLRFFDLLSRFTQMEATTGHKKECKDRRKLLPTV